MAIRKRAKYPASDDPKTCKDCDQTKPGAEFPLKPTNRDGRSNRCKKCQAPFSARYRDRYRTIDGNEPTFKPKRCKKCLVRKPANQFAYYARNADGRRGACKACEAEIRRASRQRSPEARQQERRRAAQRAGKNYVPGVPGIVQYLEDYRSTRPWLRNGLTSQEKEKLRADFDRDWVVRKRLANQLRRHYGPRRHIKELARQVRAAVQLKVRAPKVEAFLGYTAAELRARLEALFTEGMSWELFGQGLIHIDHIKPCVRFNLADPKQVKKAWAITNLQPLWALDNMRKGSKYPG